MQFGCKFRGGPLDGWEVLWRHHQLVYLHTDGKFHVYRTRYTRPCKFPKYYHYLGPCELAPAKYNQLHSATDYETRTRLGLEDYWRRRLDMVGLDSPEACRIRQWLKDAPTPGTKF